MLINLNISGSDEYVKLSFDNLFDSSFTERIVLRKAKLLLGNESENIINDLLVNDIFPIYITNNLFTISAYDRILLNIDISGNIVYYLYQNKFVQDTCFENNVVFEDVITMFIENNYQHDYFNLHSNGLLDNNASESRVVFINNLNSIIFSDTDIFINYYNANTGEFSGIADILPDNDVEFELSALNPNNWNNLEIAPTRKKHRINMLIFWAKYATYFKLPYYGFKDITNNILSGISMLIDTDVEYNNIYIYQIITIQKVDQITNESHELDTQLFRSPIKIIRSTDTVNINKFHESQYSMYKKFNKSYDLIYNAKLNPAYINNNKYQIHIHGQNLLNNIQLIKQDIVEMYNGNI